MKVRLLELINFAILVHFAVSTHVSQTCSLVDKKLQATYLADHNDCGKFIQCVHGVAVSMRCPKGLHWNRVSFTCDYPERAKCLMFEDVVDERVVKAWDNDEIQQFCISELAADKSRRIQLAHPHDSTKFLVCMNGRVLIFDCPKDLHWNAAKDKCDYPVVNKNPKIKRKKSNKNTTSIAELETSMGTNQSKSIESEQETVSRHKERIDGKSTTSESLAKTPSDFVDLQSSINFESSTTSYTDVTTESSKLLKWTPKLLKEVTKNQHDYSTSKTNEDVEKTILGESSNYLADKFVDTSQLKVEITRHGEKKLSQINIDRSITETQAFTTPWNTEQIRKVTTSEPITISPQQTKTTVTNQINISTPNLKVKENHTVAQNQTDRQKKEEQQKQQETQRQADPIKKQDEQQNQVKFNRNFIYEETSLPIKLMALTADASVATHDLSTVNVGKISRPLSKSEIDRLYSLTGMPNGQVEDVGNTRNPTQDIKSINNFTEPPTSVTLNPYQPFKAIECAGINNEERFVASNCRKYFQCHNGYAYLLNCFDGCVFSKDKKICIQSDKKCED